MPRPKRFRRLGFMPGCRAFKPAHMKMRELNEVFLGTDELEALRLKELMGLSQEQAAEHMGISQPSFHRLVSGARKKVAEALINGKALKIQDVGWAGCRGHGRCGRDTTG